MPVPVLVPVTREHCLRAIEQLAAGAPVGEYGHAISYEVRHAGGAWSPKAVLGYAASLAHGRRVSSAEFNSGEGPGQTNETLRALGFEVAQKYAPPVSGGPLLTPPVIAWLESTDVQDLSGEDVVRHLEAFRARFGPDRLGALSGEALLQRMHGRPDPDHMTYWLEFKSDDEFETRTFGSIAGGSALKYGLYRSAQDGTWRAGLATNQMVLSTAEAAAMAEAQRDELLAVHRHLSGLPDDPTDAAWADLAAVVGRLAPTFGHLAFFHKVLALWNPERLDDYHSSDVQLHVLLSLGVRPANASVWGNAALLLRALGEWRARRDEATWMCQFTARLNKAAGPVIRHWRIGTTIGDRDLWPTFLHEGCVAVGWHELGDLDAVFGAVSDGAQEAALKQALAAAVPTQSPIARGHAAAWLRRFARVIRDGDRVYAANGKTIRAIGVVTGDYRWVGEGAPAGHRRAVRWIYTTPFESPTNDGLMTVVHHLRSAWALIASASQRVLQVTPSSEPDGPTVAAPPPRTPLLEQVERKGQVLLYGPPGTGKTFHALAAAEQLVAHGVYGRAWASLSADDRRAVRRDGDPGQRIWLTTFHPAYGYEDFVEGLRARERSGALSFEPTDGLFKTICRRAAAHPDEPFVLIIDELNRGDAPRIFGELITLLELDKRGHQHCTLPLSREPFTVPRNVVLIATMNTSDRSITLLDAAFRRRFGFIELGPDPAALGGAVLDGLALGPLLVELNQRLLRVLGPRARDLAVGHAWFMRAGAPVGTARQLREVFLFDVVPLLQEYAADDPRALAQILGDQLYDERALCLRAERWAPGAEADLVAALVAWNREA
ncbi:MAG TPA: AAA family ATPase, partial [Myxococcota bacterium]|nr:AAA family ATPase [Myxococcota bacterium]